MKTFSFISFLLLLGNFYAQDTTATRIQFNKHVEIGDLLFVQKDFTGAAFHYEQACELIPNECPKKKRMVSKEAITPGCYGNEYPKLLAAADKRFNEKDYLKSKEYYRRACMVRPGDPYPKERLEEIEKMLKESE